MRQIARSDGFMGLFVQLADHITVVSDLYRYVVTFSCPFQRCSYLYYYTGRPYQDTTCGQFVWEKHAL